MSQSTAAIRRPDVDVLNIVLTWIVLVYHVLIVYCPYVPYYVKDPSIPSNIEPDSPYVLLLVSVIFIDTWIMPTFFFLSGVSSYYSLKRRTEKDFRKERVHRLLAPSFFLMGFTKGLFAFQFLVPMDSDCSELYHNSTALTTKRCLSWWGSLSNSNHYVGSFGLRVLETLLRPHPHQAWFCIYLFVYSQIMAKSFSDFPKSLSDAEVEKSICIGNDSPSQTNKISIEYESMNSFSVKSNITSLNFRKYLDVTKSLIVGALGLSIIPSIFLAVTELLLRWKFPDNRKDTFSLLGDWCNNVHFMAAYILGFLITSFDSNIFRTVVHKQRWLNFICGFILLQTYSLIYIMGDYWFSRVTKYILLCCLRGFGEWIFIIGLYAINRNMWTKSFKIIDTLRKMTMPFYLLHQQILVVLLSGTLWISYLNSILVSISLSTVVNLMVARLLLKSSGSIRYLFGLPMKPTIISGEKSWEFRQILVLCLILIFEATFVHFIRIIYH